MNGDSHASFRSAAELPDPPDEQDYTDEYNAAVLKAAIELFRSGDLSAPDREELREELTEALALPRMDEARSVVDMKTNEIVKVIRQAEGRLSTVLDHVQGPDGVGSLIAEEVGALSELADALAPRAKCQYPLRSVGNEELRKRFTAVFATYGIQDSRVVEHLIRATRYGLPATAAPSEYLCDCWREAINLYRHERDWRHACSCSDHPALKQCDCPFCVLALAAQPTEEDDG